MAVSCGLTRLGWFSLGPAFPHGLVFPQNTVHRAFRAEHDATLQQAGVDLSKRLFAELRAAERREYMLAFIYVQATRNSLDRR